MRLLHVINSTRPAGGGPIESIRQAACVLAHMGHQTEIACLDSPDSPWLKELPILTHAFGPAWTGYRYCPAFVSWLKRHANDYDAVIVHGLWLHTSGGTRSALRGSETPYFIYTHGLLDPTFKRVFPWRHVKKAILWRILEHRVVRDARALFFTCEMERDLAVQSFLPFHGTPAIVPYCVGDPPATKADQAETFFSAYPDLRGRRLILFLSRIHPKKGCDLLIEAFARFAEGHPDLHLVMAGPADNSKWYARLLESSKRLGIAHRITWTGMLQGHLKWSAFRAAEVFILPTHQENFGIAIVESLACGTPVLITNRANIYREIQADGAGLVGEAGLHGTVDLLARWLALDAEQRRTMGLRARQSFQRRFDSRQAAECLVETLQRFGVNGR